MYKHKLNLSRLISVKFYDNTFLYFQHERITYALCENYIYLHREPTRPAKIQI